MRFAGDGAGVGAGWLGLRLRLLADGLHSYREKRDVMQKYSQFSDYWSVWYKA